MGLTFKQHTTLGYMASYGEPIVDVAGNAPGTKFRIGAMAVSNQDVHDLKEAGFITAKKAAQTTYVVTSRGLLAAAGSAPLHDQEDVVIDDGAYEPDEPKVPLTMVTGAVDDDDEGGKDTLPDQSEYKPLSSRKKSKKKSSRKSR